MIFFTGRMDIGFALLGFASFAPVHGKMGWLISPARRHTVDTIGVAV
jgi:hypothetical protein